MTIETKYNLGDMVWLHLLGEPTEVMVIGLKYTISRTLIGCRYILKHNDYSFDLEAFESDLFPTKEELLKSL